MKTESQKQQRNERSNALIVIVSTRRASLAVPRSESRREHFDYRRANSQNREYPAPLAECTEKQIRRPVSERTENDVDTSVATVAPLFHFEGSAKSSDPCSRQGYNDHNLQRSPVFSA
jgi:hypothetical protein